MTGDQTFILAILAVIVTPLINYFITAQTTRAAAAAAKEAAAAAKLAAAESIAAGKKSEAAVTASNHTADRFEAMHGAIKETLAVVAKGNGQRIPVAEAAVDEAAAAAVADTAAEAAPPADV